MENLLKLFAAVFLFSPAVLGDQCQDKMGSQLFMECIGGFTTYMQANADNMNSNDETAMQNVLCSTEGQKAFGCLFDIFASCPDIFSSMGGGMNPLASLDQIEGFDMNTIINDGGIEGLCALITGPCSKVQECMVMSPGGSSVMKRGASMDSINNYVLFLTQAGQLCGEMKGQIECMMDKLQSCPKSVISKAEADFEKAIKMSMPDAYGIVSFKDTHHFIKSECSFLAQDSVQAQKMCVQGVFTGTNFTKCAKKAQDTYAAEQNCDVYMMNHMCIEDNLVEVCGQEAADFFVRNTHFIFPGVPDDCAERINSGHVLKISFGILLMSLLASFVKNL